MCCLGASNGASAAGSLPSSIEISVNIITDRMPRLGSAAGRDEPLSVSLSFTCFSTYEVPYLGEGKRPCQFQLFEEEGTKKRK